MTQDVKEEELIEGLTDVGIPKKQALTLAMIADNDEAKREDIQGSTNMNQPDVSLATEELRNKDWLEKREIEKEGKGRPAHAYSLKKSMDEIAKDIEKEKQEKIRGIEDNIERIKELVDTLY